MYEYNAEVIRVVDGDTLWARVDLGCDVKLSMSLRLEGIDAPEMSEVPIGLEAKKHLEGLIGDFFVLNTIKDKKEKYGRYRAIILVKDPATGLYINVNERMVRDGHAVYKNWG
jgi:micrococcal nuclease